MWLWIDCITWHLFACTFINYYWKLTIESIVYTLQFLTDLHESINFMWRLSLNYSFIRKVKTLINRCSEPLSGILVTESNLIVSIIYLLMKFWISLSFRLHDWIHKLHRSYINLVNIWHACWHVDMLTCHFQINTFYIVQQHSNTIFYNNIINTNYFYMLEKFKFYLKSKESVFFFQISVTKFFCSKDVTGCVWVYFLRW